MLNWMSKLISPPTPRIAIAIRAVHPRDLSSIVSILGDPSVDEARIRRFLQQQYCGVIIGDRGGFVVSYAMFIVNRTVFKVALNVHPDFRRGGVGTQMVDYFKGRLDPRRRPRMMGLVDERNLNAQLFFRALGFEATGSIDGHHFADGCTKYCFQYRMES